MTGDGLNPIKGWRYTHPLAFDGRCGMIRGCSVLVLILIAWLDYVTGYEFGFFIFYFIPVAITSWYCGRRAGIVTAFASAAFWYLSDYYSYHPYSKAYFIYWEMFMRLVSFLTTALTLSRIRLLVLNEEQMMTELLAARRELQSYRDGKNPNA